LFSGRSRFERQILSDDPKTDGLAASGPAPLLEEPSRALEPPRTGQQRELFSLPGPSLDFQQGSVVPAQLPSRAGAQLSRGLVNLEDDYNEFGSRFVQNSPPRVISETKPVYVIPYKKVGLRVAANQTLPSPGIEDGAETESPTTRFADGVELTTEYYLDTTPAGSSHDDVDFETEAH